MSLLCDVCGKAFTRSDNLNQHKKNVHGHGTKLSCRICMKEFNRNSNLLKHQRQVHKIFERGLGDQKTVHENEFQLIMPNRYGSSDIAREFTFKTPFTMIVSGATSSVKVDIRVLFCLYNKR